MVGKATMQVEDQKGKNKGGYEGDGVGEPETVPGEQVHHGGEQEVEGEGSLSPKREPSLAIPHFQQQPRGHCTSQPLKNLCLLPSL